METIFRWVHLSDIHVGHGDAEHGWDQKLVMSVLLKDIAAQVQSKHRPIDAVLVTGDVAFSGNGRRSTEYDDAKAWFGELARAVGVTTSQIYMVPGNHDVDRGADKDGNTRRLVGPLRRGGSDKESKIDTVLADGGARALLARRMAAYLTFADDFAPARRRAKEPPEARLFWNDLLITPQGLHVRLLGLNTALLAADEADFGKLQLGKEQLRPLTASEGELVMVLSHHPFDGGWLADQRDAEAWVRNHAHVHLSGHVHEAETEASRKGAGDVFVRVVAGSVHGDQGGPAGHGYSFGEVIRADDGKAKIRIWPRKWSPKRMGFILDVENVEEGEQYAEHDLRLSLPVAPSTPARAPTAISAPTVATPTTAPTAPTAPTPRLAPATGLVNVFISYCDDDEQLKNKLDKSLRSALRQKVVMTSHASVMPGEEWRPAIERYLASAEIILILLSADYLASEQSYDFEFARVQIEHATRGAIVLPILLRPCHLTEPWLTKLNIYPQESGKVTPVTSWPNQDLALQALTRVIEFAVDSLRTPRS